MSKERRAKHVTTPRPNRWQSFRSKNLALRKKSKGAEDFNSAHLDRIGDVVEEMKDPFHFASETSLSPEGSDTSEDLSWKTIESETALLLSSRGKSDESIWSTEGMGRSSESIEFSSPEKMRFRDSDDSTIPYRDSVFSSSNIEGVDSDVLSSDSSLTAFNFGKPKLTSTRNEGIDIDVTFCGSIIPTPKIRERKSGNHKLTSTRNEGIDNDVICCESIIPTTETKRNFRKTGKFVHPQMNLESTSHQNSVKGKRNFVDSHLGNPENTSPQIPVGIDYIKNFIKTPPLEDSDYEVDDEVVEVPVMSPIPILLKTFVNEEDKSDISKFFEEKENLEFKWPGKREEEDLQGEYSLERNSGNHKLTSTRNEGIDNDVICCESIIPTTETRLPVGIDYIKSFIKTPPLEDSDYEVDDEVVEIPVMSPIPILLKTFVNEEDKSDISKFSEEENLELKWPGKREENDLQVKHSLEFPTTINSADIVDDVFKNSNDTSSLKMNDAVFQQTSLEESQAVYDIDSFEETRRRKRKSKKPVTQNNASVAEDQDSNLMQKKRKPQHWWKRRVMAKSPCVTENQDSNLIQKKRKSQNRWKRRVIVESPSVTVTKDSNLMQKKRKSQDWWKRRVTLKSASVTENQDSNLKRRKSRNRRKKNKTDSKMAEEYVQYLKTHEMCPLRLSTASFADSKGSVHIKEEGSSKEKKKSFRRNRRRNRTQIKIEGECNEYKKYMQSLPVCSFSIKTPKNEIGKTFSCSSIKKEPI